MRASPPSSSWPTRPAAPTTSPASSPTWWPSTGRASAQAIVDRADIALGAVGSDDAGGHLVHHVADGGAAVEVHQDDRAAPAAPVAGAALGHVRHRLRLGQRVADAEAQRHAEDEVGAVALLVEDEADGVRG